MLGGESSGGLTIRGHILGKDGIFASALVVEMLARTGKKISQLLETVYALTGRLYRLEENFPATPEMRIAVPRNLRETPEHPCRPLLSSEDLAHGRHQALPGKRQLGAAAILGNRAGPAAGR